MAKAGKGFVDSKVKALYRIENSVILLYNFE